MALLDDELQALYALRPDDFVRARNELVRALRKEDRRDDADAAAKLRRPSVTAAALNHVALEEPALVATLLEQEARLRDAMERAVKGNADDVRPAQATARRAADAVVTAARRRLEQLGQSDNDAAAQRIINTLRAAALDDGVSQRLRRGILDADVVASGFGFGDIALDEAAPAPAPRKKKVKGSEAPADERTQARERAARLSEARAEAKQLAMTAAKLATAADKAERQLDALREQAELLQERVRNADRDARRARQNAEKASHEAALAHERTAALDGGGVATQHKR